MLKFKAKPYSANIPGILLRAREVRDRQMESGVQSAVLDPTRLGLVVKARPRWHGSL